jgi:16S rRNA G966 N2-methylase RsmD
VFLDPPFRQGWLDRVWPALAPVLAPDARLYVESDAPVDPAALAAGLSPSMAAQVTLCRADKAGQVHYHLFDIGQPAAQGDT